MKLVFMGTPDFAVPVLEALVTEHQVVAVYTQGPKPAGHGMKLTKSPVQVKAEELGIPIQTPKTLRDAGAQEVLKTYQPEAIIVCAYGLILPQAVLDIPPKGCINVHASLLPRWRGAAPIQRAIEAGDTESGITIMQMDAGLDTGDMLAVQKVKITPEMTGGELHDTLMQIGGPLVLDVLKNPLNPVKQPETGATYAQKMTKEETALDWHQDAEVLARKVRAFSPWPKTFFMMGDTRLFVLKATAIALDKPTPAGTVLADGVIACGVGALQIKTIQRAGKAPMAFSDFARGFTWPVGERLAI